MKRFFRFIITKLLASLARKRLKKNHIGVIAITGSVGKTTTKEAMYHILKQKFRIACSSKGFNTELGVSLSILEEEKSGFSSPLAWIKIIKRALKLKKPDFQKIILEMGADKPGDIQKLVNIAKPSIGVITNINPVHLQKGQFHDLEDIRREKNNLIRKLTGHETAILNFDDPLVKSMETGAQKMGFGTGPDAQVQAGEPKIGNDHIDFQVSYMGETKSFKVPILGKFQIYTLLPAITVALKLGISLQECAEALKNFKLPPSRMNPIEGLNDSLIIDSSYNASPASVGRALELLGTLPAKRKIAALGTMNELGDNEKEEHLRLGRETAQVANVLITVGMEASTIKQGAVSAGMDEKNIYTFFDSEEAGHFLKTFVQANDLILVKGSQNKVRMERLVKIIMKHPEQAPQLLCRQEEAWENI